MIHRPHPLDQGLPPDWASAWGEDNFGVYVAFRVGEVEQRMRWIEGGTFPLGSPSDEVGRQDQEFPVRAVAIAGFWLANTPCTQELWRQVMGSNPSRYQSPTRPVEHVTWDECVEFCAKLSGTVPGLRLPTEDEWEFACRAGTSEATWAGELEILGANNAPVLDDIAWYGGNSGRNYDLEKGDNPTFWPDRQYQDRKAGTRPVGLKKANPLGLYDMLGNVYEWCEDPWRDSLEAQPRRTARVIRGGSWNLYAGFVRAAFRIWHRPLHGWDNLGFRIAGSR